MGTAASCEPNHQQEILIVIHHMEMETLNPKKPRVRGAMNTRCDQAASHPALFPNHSGQAPAAAHTSPRQDQGGIWTRPAVDDLHLRTVSVRSPTIDSEIGAPFRRGICEGDRGRRAQETLALVDIESPAACAQPQRLSERHLSRSCVAPARVQCIASLYLRPAFFFFLFLDDGCASTCSFTRRDGRIVFSVKGANESLGPFQLL